MIRWLALALVGLLHGCAHAPRGAGHGAGLHADELRYELELVRSPFTMVKVTVDSLGAAEGTTTFDMGEEFGGIERAVDEVHGLSIRGQDGRSLSPEHPHGSRWIVRHQPGERLTLTYYLVSARQDLTHESETYYRAVVRDELVHLIGETALLFPAHLDDERPRRIGLRWVGFEEAGWTFVSSFGTEAALEVLQTTSAFRHALFLASSDLRLVPRQTGGGMLVVGLVGKWRFSDADFADLAQRIVASQRSFFDDPGPAFYLITAIPVGEDRPGYSMTGGTGLTGSFATFLSPGLSLTGPHGDRVVWLLGHELFHSWNGQVVRPAEPTPLVYWFTEGFTNFYTRRLLYRAGLLSLEAYLTDLNEAVSDYLLSPARNEPNARIEKDFWKSQAVQKLPYLRGDVVALLVDREIRRATQGRESLDELMRDLVARSRASGKRLATSDLLSAIESRTSRGFAEKLRAIIEEGATADVPPSIFGECLAGEVKPIGRFELGFDLVASKPGRRVVGVVPGSPAERAGLRDGQALVSWSFGEGDSAKQVELAIQEGGEQREIRYLPQGAPVPVPRFIAGDANACMPDLL